MTKQQLLTELERFDAKDEIALRLTINQDTMVLKLDEHMQGGVDYYVKPVPRLDITVGYCHLPKRINEKGFV